MSQQLNYDPKLREAMAEIKEVMKKHNVGGFLAIGNKTHFEFAVAIDIPTWSTIRFTTENGLAHLKLHTKSRKEDTEATVGLVVNLQDLCALGFQQLDIMKAQIEKHVEIEHTKFGKNGISNEGRT